MAVCKDCCTKMLFCVYTCRQRTVTIVCDISFVDNICIFL